MAQMQPGSFTGALGRSTNQVDGEDSRIGPVLAWAVPHPEVSTHQVVSSEPEALKHAAGLNVPDINRQVFWFLIQLLDTALDDIVTHVQNRGLELWRTLHVRWDNRAQRALWIKMRQGQVADRE